MNRSHATILILLGALAGMTWERLLPTAASQASPPTPTPTATVVEPGDVFHIQACEQWELAQTEVKLHGPARVPESPQRTKPERLTRGWQPMSHMGNGSWIIGRCADGEEDQARAEAAARAEARSKAVARGEEEAALAITSLPAAHALWSTKGRQVLDFWIGSKISVVAIDGQVTTGTLESFAGVTVTLTAGGETVTLDLEEAQTIRRH